MIEAKELGLHRDVTSQSVLCPSKSAQLMDSEEESEAKQGWGSWLYNSFF